MVDQGTRVEDLITVQAVQDAAAESSEFVGDNPRYQIEQTLRDVQGYIAEYLGMEPIVHEHTERITRHEWREDETATSTDKGWIAWARHQPVVEVEAPTDVEPYFDGKRFAAGGPDALRVTYFAGWKRADQTDGEQQGRLTDLDTEPPDLPRDIRRAAINLTLFELNRQEHGAGIGQVVQSIGQGQQATVEGVDTSFIERQFRRISSHKVSEM